MAGKMDVRDHGWFVFFAPRDNPQIAGVVFAEHAEHGANAAPIAKYAIETYFAKQEGKPLPTAAAGADDDRAGRRQGSVTPAVAPADAGRSGAARLTLTMFERRLYFHVDWLLLAAILVITGIGIAMIYSTTYVTLPDGGHAGPQVRTQVYALVIGLVAFLVVPGARLPHARGESLFLYAALVALLLFVLLKGSTQMGAQRWIPIGPFNLQPSEFGAASSWRCILAMYFGENRRGARNPGDLDGRRHLHGRAAACSSPSSPTSAPP